MSIDRQARIANGVLILGAAACAVWGDRWVGLALVACMGVSLIFSGAANFCGFARLLPALPWNWVLKQTQPHSPSPSPTERKP